jgi:hypothetical protein
MTIKIFDEQGNETFNLKVADGSKLKLDFLKELIELIAKKQK